ncbi:MAG: hypothetical protein WBP79_06085 [Candidatus Acidiferrales bacterium]
MNTSAFAHSVRFLREHTWKLLAISAALLAPCFWHRVIEAGDLGSHLYNAWLVQLIERGQASGLWITRQWNNVLFDFLLSGLGSIFNLYVAEKIAVSLAVLVFFWGAFTFVSAATGRPPWGFTPLLAMISYGWTLQMGFFNYYLSIGISFFALAIFWRGSGWERFAAVPLAGLVLLAHPLGFLWLIGAAVYIEIIERVSFRYHFVVLLAAAGALYLVRFYLAHHYIMDGPDESLYLFNGADQFLLFNPRYRFPSVAVIFLVIVFVGVDLIRRRREDGLSAQYSIPAQLFVIAELGVLLLPDGIHLPEYPVAVALITERLTSISAVLACCLLDAMRPRFWHLAGFGAIAAIFFSFVYQDTATINRMEVQVESLVHTLPPGQRVMATILPLPGSRVLIQHMVDHACIGYCFSYGNYEAASGQFRVRARPNNPFVMTQPQDTGSMEEGTYTVQPQDLPVWQIYQCSMTQTDLCIRPLAAGEDNDAQGDHPP